MTSKRILIVITTAFVPTGGLASVMMNYYRKMSKTGLQINFASTNEAPACLVNELNQYESRYFCLGKRSDVKTYFSRLKRLCKGYDIVHINANSATAVIELMAAKMAGVKILIDHNHTTHTDHPYLNIFLKPIFRKLYTVGLACSEDAGSWLFGKGKFSVLTNAIDVRKYKFSTSLREKYRKDWGVSCEAFVIGHVGKINAQKNHFKLLEVFEEYQKTHGDTVLLCVGYGPLQEELEKRAAILGLKDKVIITGERTDVPGFLSAMDVFVFPSRWEGLGMAVIEAQASGLPCLVSDQVPKDVYMSEMIDSVGVSGGAELWCEKIDKLRTYDRDMLSRRNVEEITKNGYNIETEAENLRKIYID